MTMAQQIRKPTVVSLGISALAGLLLGGEYQYQKWRINEIKKIDKNAKEFLLNGVVALKYPDANIIERKKKVWEKSILPHMVNHWESIKSDFNINDKKTWPSGGKKTKFFSSVDQQVPACPRLVSENFDVQALICYLFDSNLELVHFGPQTHPKLKLLINRLWALPFGIGKYLYEKNWIRPKFSSFLSVYRQQQASLDNISTTNSSVTDKHSFGYFEIEGEDQSWHLCNFPNYSKKYSVGEKMQDSEHFDGGSSGVFTEGIPPKLSVNLMIKKSQEKTVSISHRDPLNCGNKLDNDSGGTSLNNDNNPVNKNLNINNNIPENIERIVQKRLLLMLLHQLAILFYCETPGYLGQVHGATGFDKHSHLVMIEAIKQLLKEESYGLAESSPELFTRDINYSYHTKALRETYHLYDESMKSGTKRLVMGTFLSKFFDFLRGEKKERFPVRDKIVDTIGKMRQIPLESNEILLAHGLMVHALFYALETMENDQIRVIQNCKISANDRLLKSNSTPQSNRSSINSSSPNNNNDMEALLEIILTSNSLLKLMVEDPIDFYRKLQFIERQENEDRTKTEKSKESHQRVEAANLKVVNREQKQFTPLDERMRLAKVEMIKNNNENKISYELSENRVSYFEDFVKSYIRNYQKCRKESL